MLVLREAVHWKETKLAENICWIRLSWLFKSGQAYNYTWAAKIVKFLAHPAERKNIVENIITSKAVVILKRPKMNPQEQCPLIALQAFGFVDKFSRRLAKLVDEDK